MIHAPATSRAVLFGRCLLAACVALALWGCDDSRPRRRGAGRHASSAADVVAELLDENVPFEFNFDLQDINGNRLSKSDFAGKVLIVDIWGTWCGPCRMEIPHFVALDRKYRDQGLQIVGLNYERTRNAAAAKKQVREVCTADGVTYPCALVTEEVLEQVPGFDAFPTTLFLDHTGKVRMKLVGLSDLPLLQAAVETLLKEIPPPESTAADDAKDSNGGDKKPANE
jgi:thiol-disulfide isomerase/thioredoxin